MIPYVARTGPFVHNVYMSKSTSCLEFYAIYFGCSAGQSYDGCIEQLEPPRHNSEKASRQPPHSVIMIVTKSLYLRSKEKAEVTNYSYKLHPVIGVSRLHNYASSQGDLDTSGLLPWSRFSRVTLSWFCEQKVDSI